MTAMTSTRPAAPVAGRCDTSEPAAPHDGASPPAGGEPTVPLTPLRKAALLVVSLDEPLAAQLLAGLDRDAVEAITLEMARLNGIDPDQQRAVLDEFYALGLRRLRFVFDDVERLAESDLRIAYHDEDVSTWALALAGAPGRVRQHVLAALPAASAEPLRDCLDRLGPFRLDDAETAQADLAERLRLLHDRGQITLPDPDAREDFLV